MTGDRFEVIEDVAELVEEAPRALPIKAVPVARLKAPEIAAPVPIKARPIARDPDPKKDETGAKVEPPRAGLIRRVYGWVALQAARVFGALVLMIGLAVLAVIPIVQLLSLGYLLEASGRVGRSGRLRDGFIGLEKASRVGGLILGVWLTLQPLFLLSSYYVDARIIDPGGPVASKLAIALAILTALLLVHIAVACACGGKLRRFLFPFWNPVILYRSWRQGGLYARARDGVWDFARSLRLPHYFSLGLRGFLGSLIWLVIPITLLALGLKAPVIGVLGGFLVVLVVLYLPFLQVHFAAENRFRAIFDIRAVRQRFARAPIAFWTGLHAALLFPLPLYLLKIEVIPRGAGWMPSLIFIAFMFPARLLTGWAYGRAGRREENRHWFVRWAARLTTPLVAIVYAYAIFATQYISWEGIGSLYGQHAFLLPVPFFDFPQ